MQGNGNSKVQEVRREYGAGEAAMKARTVVFASAVLVAPLAVGYGLFGGAHGWLAPIEAAVAAIAGVNHPVMFAEVTAAARVFNILAITSGLAMRVCLFAAVTVWLLRKRLQPRRESHAPGGRETLPLAAPTIRTVPDWLGVGRN
jgi:hypothetical protein